jgi:hypothetical protein
MIVMKLFLIEMPLNFTNHATVTKSLNLKDDKIRLFTIIFECVHVKLISNKNKLTEKGAKISTVLSGPSYVLVFKILE